MGIEQRTDVTLVGRCAALAVAAEARRRAAARRAGDVPAQPLRDYLAAETAGLAATTLDDRVLTLEALRDDEHREHERAAARRRELRRR